jgi:hypothetical protein
MILLSALILGGRTGKLEQGCTSLKSACKKLEALQCLQHRGRITGYAEVIRSPTLDRWVVSASETRKLSVNGCR